MPDCLIRSATEKDIPSVLELWKTAGGPASPTDTPQSISGLLRFDPGALLVAQGEAAVIGTLIAVWDGWRASFYRLAVHPARRRQGVASALIRAGERRVLELGALRLTALVDDRDQGAVAFWQAAGYERQQHRARFIRHPQR